ncbi:MAG: CBS domain-containing protein [Pirellulales bacterium]|nr:CBS domain-containing protein [Pirellulales bacterium]
MNSAIERLLSLRARDVMTRSVVELSANQTMSQAAFTLRQHEVTGAPVVDEQGRCVGIISATDFVRREATVEDEGNGHGGADLSEHMLSRQPGVPSYIGAMTCDLVRHYMSPAVQSIDEDATLPEIGRVMCEAHIHRVVVLDRRGVPVGIVSSLDVVSALVNAIEE